MKKKKLDQIVNKQRKSAKKYHSGSDEHQRTYYSSTKSQSLYKSSNFKKICPNLSNIKDKKSNISKEFSDKSLEDLLNPQKTRFENFNPFKDLEVKAPISRKTQKFFTQFGDQRYAGSTKFNDLKGKHKIIRPFSHIEKKKTKKVKTEKVADDSSADLMSLIGIKYKLNIEQIAKIDQWVQILKELASQKPSKSKEVELLIKQLSGLEKRKQKIRDQQFRIISEIIE